MLSKVLSENSRGHLDAKELECTETIHSAGQNLLELINDILDIAKVEAGKLRLEAKTIEIQELVSTLSHLFAPFAAEKGLTWDIVIDTGCPDRFVSDSRRVQQVLRNFLSNAFKFTDHGKVMLRVSMCDELQWMKACKSNESVLRFTVTDTGIGISEKDRSTVFEAFQQVDGSITRRHGGTGLGLSISKNLTEVLGGALHLESEPGVGSVFYLYLPVEMEQEGSQLGRQQKGAQIDAQMTHLFQSSLQPLQPHYSAADEEVSIQESEQRRRRAELQLDEPAKVGLFDRRSIKGAGSRDITIVNRANRAQRGKRVLVVDDDMRNVFSLKELLNPSGYEVTVGKNGREALSQLEKYPDTDLILMDIMMPEMNGYDAMREIRTQSRFKKVPIIAWPRSQRRPL